MEINKLLTGIGTKIYEPITILCDEKHRIEIGNHCSIGQYSFIGARNFVMKDYSEICPGVLIAGGGDVTLMEKSTISFGAKLIPATFTKDGKYMNDNVSEQETNIIRGSITIGEGAYVGAGAVVCVSEAYKDIKIGDHAVIGALTYIDKDVRADTIIHHYQHLTFRERHKEIVKENVK